jgi:hypothetical protein
MEMVGVMIKRAILVMAAAGLIVFPAMSQPSPAPPGPATQRDGQHDFDWEIGRWTTHVRVLRNPLTGAAPDWVEFRGTSDVKPILGGRANSVELSVRNEKGAIEGVALRLYSPKTGQWSLNYAPVGSGSMTSPVFGSFDGKGRGEFHGPDTLDGRAIQVRFVINRPSATEARFEQYYSADGGKSWELNWLAVDTLQPDAAPAR